MSRPKPVHQYVKLPMPGGKVVYLSEESYTLFCRNVSELVRCMEQAEYVGVAPHGTKLVMNRPVSEWPKLLGAAVQR